MAHGVQTESRGVVDLAVDVQRAAQIVVGAQTHVARDEVLVLGLLGGDVDGATCAAATSVGGVCTLDDFHGFDVEHFAGAGGDVAHAVHKGAGLGVHAADEGLVAAGVAAFAVAEGDAGGGAQSILQAGGTCLLDDLFIDDLNGLGRVQQGRGELALRAGFGLEAGVGSGFHIHGGQGGFLLSHRAGANQAQACGNHDLLELTAQAVGVGRSQIVVGHAFDEESIFEKSVRILGDIDNNSRYHSIMAADTLRFVAVRQQTGCLDGRCGSCPSVRPRVFGMA